MAKLYVPRRVWMEATEKGGFFEGTLHTKAIEGEVEVHEGQPLLFDGGAFNALFMEVDKKDLNDALTGVWW